MTYDAGRKRIVLFGGDGDSGVVGDTWEWDGRSWAKAAETGPPARAAHRMEYDALRKRTVLFGGTSAFGRNLKPALTDTWEWDGREWVRIDASGPAGRILFGSAFDSKRGKVILFGGNTAHKPPMDAGLSAETWEWDGRSWQEIKAPGPPARDHNVMVFDVVRGLTVLYGGGARGVLLGDTWEFNGTSWSKSAAASPSMLGADTMAFDSRRKKVITYGGWSTEAPLGPRPDLWEYDGEHWTRIR